MLFSLNCITEEQRDFIQRQHSNREKNAELLQIVRFFDDKKFSDFSKCLRRSSQMKVARIVENGGVVIRVKVNNSGAAIAEWMNPQLLHLRINALRSRKKPRSHQTDKLISQLKDEGIEILNSQLDRQTVVVWIWCRSQAALEYIQKLYESNQLRDVFFESIQPSTSNMITIDGNQFKKAVAMCPISINFAQRIRMPEKEFVYGVTKLRNEIFVLCQSESHRNAICVFEDRNPFRLQKRIEIYEMENPVDIGSSEKDDCLYVSDANAKCVWKITIEIGDTMPYRIVKFLFTQNKPWTLSVSSDGHLLMVNCSSSILWIYGSDAELIRSIRLPREMEGPYCALETSIGNIVIIHEWEEEVEGGSCGRDGRKKRDILCEAMNDEAEDESWSVSATQDGEEEEKRAKWVVSELSRDGQMVMRRFVPSNESQQLKNPEYFSLDSDDRVFVADTGNGRVIILDSDLKWNRILFPAKAEETKIHRLWRLCYDEEEKQLIVGEFFGSISLYAI